MRKVLVILLITFSLVLSAAPFASAALPAYKVSMTVNKTVSEAGKFVIVSGKVVGPRAAGRNVTIQRRYVGGAWTTVAFATVKSTGKYSARVETPRGGTTSFRVIKPRSAVRKAGVSPTRSLPVYEWLYLANQGVDIQIGPVVAPIELKLTSETIYKRSIAFYEGDSRLLYKLAGKCTKFTTFAGYRSSDPAVDTMSVNVGNGLGSSVGYPVNLGTTITINTSTVGLNYLALELDGVDSTYVAGLGNPRVYCNADHLASYDTTDG